MARRILIVDDSGSFRRTASELLVLRGFEVLPSACDGAAAVDAVTPSCPDGVLLDINLPDADGLAVAEALAAACPAMKIVLTSAAIDDVAEAELRHCGAVAFLPKEQLAVVDLRELFGGQAT